MASGSYDIDGKCVNCNQFHPCSCEYDNGSEQADEMEMQMERRLDNYLTWMNEERD